MLEKHVRIYIREIIVEQQLRSDCLDLLSLKTLSQIKRLPGYLRPIFAVATIAGSTIFRVEALAHSSVTSRGPSQSFLGKMRNSRVGLWRDVVRFYESITLLFYYE